MTRGVGGGVSATAPRKSVLRSVAQAARSRPTAAILIGLAVLLFLDLLGDPERAAKYARVLMLWALWAVHAARFAHSMWNVDGRATLLIWLAFMAKILLALPPMGMFIWCAPRWRLLGLLGAGCILFAAPAYLRACPTLWHWAALCLLSGLGVFLVRYRYLRWSVALPMIVLLGIPSMHHNVDWTRTALAERCSRNDGQRPANLDVDQVGPYYYGVHLFPQNWILLMGQSSNEGRFMGIPHEGRSSWWLRRKPDGTLFFESQSEVTGNTWNSCLLGEDAWMIRAGFLQQVRPPTDGHEVVRRFPFHMLGFDAADTACDERSQTVFASDLFDGRLFEYSPAKGGTVERRADSVSERGGLMMVRKTDGRLVILDIQNLIVYAPDESRVLQRIPAAMASTSLSLCQADGAVAVPDLAGRLRVFRVDADGHYEFDWGIDLIAPRLVRFSPDCNFLGVTSGDDRHVWIIKRASRQIIKTFNLGPAIRGAAFTGPRDLAVADACTISLLRF
jgi:hypothetical protein